MSGTGPDTFSPALETSTAMVALTLARIFGADGEGFTAPGQNWYSAAYAWLRDTGAFTDIAEPTPDRTIERGQVAAIVYQLINQMDVSLTLPDYVQTFSDANLMSDEEIDAFRLLYSLGIIQGTGGGYINPRGNLTRAEITAILAQHLNVGLTKIQAQKE